jgi:hypothetical protein
MESAVVFLVSRYCGECFPGPSISTTQNGFFHLASDLGSR